MTESAYLDLFDADPEDEDGLLALAAPSPAERCGRMRYITRSTLAGDYRYVDIYPRFGPDQIQKCRTARKAASPEQVARANQRARVRKLAALMNANFTEKDYFLTLTYEREVCKADAKRDVQNYLRRVNRLRDRLGLDAGRYIYCLEDEDGEGRRTRTHIHLCLSGGIPREQLERLWGRGLCNCARLQPEEKGLEGLSRYFLKTQGRAGNRIQNARSWSCSKNLKKPKVRKSQSKFSNAKVRRMVEDLRFCAEEEFEKAFPKYAFVECRVHYSDVTEGVYLEAVLRRRR